MRQTRHGVHEQLAAVFLEAIVHTAKAAGLERGGDPLRLLGPRPDEQEATTAGAGDLAADRALAPGKGVKLVQAGVADAAGQLALLLPRRIQDLADRVE